ncbi:hypothetical protein ACYX34_18005 [Nitrospira sp. CMX1]|nr:hypothetical protein [Nitrospira sp.]
MNRKRVGIPFLLSGLCLFISACATSGTVEDTIFSDGPRGAVLLQHVDDSWFTTAHPVSVSPLLLTHMLRGVQVQPAPDDQTTALRVFSDEEIAFLSPLMSTALSKATKNQLVAFRVAQSTDPGGAMTGGLLFTRGRLLHLWLTYYRAPNIRTDAGTTLDRQARNPQGLAPRQLRFVPETAQRSSHNQQPDVIDPPPLATLVIDYTMLATVLNLPSEVAPAQPLSGDAPLPPDHGIPAAQATRTSPSEETRVLKELVEKQAIELDALKEDMRALRRRLSEREVPPLNSPLREQNP